MKQHILSKIAGKEGDPTSEELIELFSAYVSEVKDPNFIKLLHRDQVNKLLIIYIYEYESKRLKRRKTLVRFLIQKALNVSLPTIYRYCPAEESKNT